MMVSFDDWNGVTYPDFILSGKGAVISAKVDYDANYIYIYVEFDSIAENAGIGRSYLRSLYGC